MSYLEEKYRCKLTMPTICRLVLAFILLFSGVGCDSSSNSSQLANKPASHKEKHNWIAEINVLFIVLDAFPMNMLEEVYAKWFVEKIPNNIWELYYVQRKLYEKIKLEKEEKKLKVLIEEFAENKMNLYIALYKLQKEMDSKFGNGIMSGRNTSVTI